MRDIDELLDELNSFDKHQHIEAKATADSIGNSVLETISAFSNEPGLNGGYLLLGVSKSADGKKYIASGISDPDKLQNELVGLCSSRFSSLIRPQITVK